MPRIKIDNKFLDVSEGTPLIKAAQLAGVEIPSMCWREGKDHITSCMICMVKDASNGKLIPSCSVEAKEGMEILTMDDEIQESRKTALDLLLSEHVGDCEAPCQITCPAHMDIPLMNRLLAKGNFQKALEVVKKDIALPAVFGRICPAPCEGACRRKTVDEAVSICLLKRAAGDFNLGAADYYIPQKEKEKGKTVEIIGAGPAGLAAAYFLQLKGYQCNLWDSNSKAGGTLWREVDSGILPLEILEKELEVIKKLGTRFKMNTKVNSEQFRKLKSSADAVIICVGSESDVSDWGLEMSDRGFVTDKQSYQSSDPKVFVVGSALKPTKLAIRSLGQGKEVSFSVDQFLRNEKPSGEYFMFNSRFGKLLKDEVAEYMKESVEGKRSEPVSFSEGFSREQVMTEAARCLHCDCRKINDCKLRIYSDHYSADQKRFWSKDRNTIRKHFQHDTVVYEVSKCIKCGICVDITKEYKEDLGLTFIGRGFDIEIGIPFSKNLENGLKKVALEVASACPTGAISEKEKKDPEK
jgi:glutamate synthase (NADPH) small chain